MTVGELISVLSEMNTDDVVYIGLISGRNNARYLPAADDVYSAVVGFRFEKAVVIDVLDN